MSTSLKPVRRLELRRSETATLLLTCWIGDGGHVVEFASAASLVQDLAQLKVILLERGVLLPFAEHRWFLPCELMLDKIEAGKPSADWIVREPWEYTRIGLIPNSQSTSTFSTIRSVRATMQ
jgi:hypothetical protein